jgi:adenylate cyclase class 2
MKQRHETEIKLAVADLKATRRRLKELGFRPVVARHFESNYLYDFPDLRLRRARSLVRIRFERNAGLLTFKGAPLASRNYKIREEIETRVEDGHRLAEVLRRLGLREVFVYEKFRTQFAPPGKRDAKHAPQLVLDETPVGTYLELEGPQRWIDAVARQLGYARRDYITDSYAALYRQKCQEQGIALGNMIFPKRES